MQAAAATLRELPARRRAAVFERECERLRPLGEAYVLRRFGASLNQADAEDAVAEVLIRLYDRLAAGQEPQNLRATFFTSVRNAAIDQLRSRAARPTVSLERVAETPAFCATPVERAEQREDAVRLGEALARLRGNYREAIVLRFGLGLSAPQIADRLGVSLPAAKKLLLRATAQVRKRLAAIEGQEFCPQMRQLARCSLFEKEASGLASEAEERILRAHFEHCGSCRSFLASLHENLHELGGAALFGLAAAQQSAWTRAAAQFGDWFSRAAQGAQSVGARIRFAAFKASGALRPTDAGPSGALAGGGQKIAALCTAGVAATATCLASGIVGPGIGISAPSAAPDHDAPPAKVRAAYKPQPPPPAPPSEPRPAAAPEPDPSAPHPSAQSPTPQPPETPAKQSQTEFGVPQSSSPAPQPSSPPASTPGPPTSSGSGSGPAPKSKSATESFGFHG